MKRAGTVHCQRFDCWFPMPCLSAFPIAIDRCQPAMHHRWRMHSAYFAKGALRVHYIVVAPSGRRVPCLGVLLSCALAAAVDVPPAPFSATPLPAFHIGPALVTTHHPRAVSLL